MTWRAAVADAVADLEPELRRLTQDLISIPSVGGTAAESEAQHFLARWLAGHGLDVAVQEVPIDASAAGFPGMEVPRDSVVRVVGRLPGSSSGPDLLLLGHTDVVPAAPQAFAPRWDGERLLGRGASDMKSGMAAMCVAAVALARSGAPRAGDLVLAPVSAEEDGGAGTFALLTPPDPLRLADGSAVIIAEPTGGRIVTGNAGALTFRIRLHGRAAHGALRWQGVNPLESIDIVLRALRDLETSRCRDAGPLFDDWPLAYPISIGTIAGGDWASTVPEDVVMTGRYGVRLGESMAQARAVFEQALARAAADSPWLSQHPPEITWWGAQFASAATDPGAAVIAALRAAGATGALAAAPYGSDLRLTVGLAGLPTVQFGPGRPEAAHTAQESVHWPDVVASATTIALAAGHFLGPGDVDNEQG